MSKVESYQCGYPVGAQYQKVRFTTSNWLAKQLELHISFEKWVLITKKRKSKKFAPREEGVKREGSRVASYITKYVARKNGCSAEDVLLYAFPDKAIITAVKITRAIGKLVAQGVLCKLGAYGHYKYYMQVK